MSAGRCAGSLNINTLQELVYNSPPCYRALCTQNEDGRTSQQQFRKWIQDVSAYEMIHPVIDDTLKVSTVIDNLRGPTQQHLLLQVRPHHTWAEVRQMVDNFFANSYTQQVRQPATSNYVRGKEGGKAKKGKGKGKKGEEKGYNNYYNYNYCHYNSYYSQQQPQQKGKSQRKGSHRIGDLRDLPRGLLRGWEVLCDTGAVSWVAPRTYADHVPPQPHYAHFASLHSNPSAYSHLWLQRHHARVQQHQFPSVILHLRHTGSIVGTTRHLAHQQQRLFYD